MHFTLRVLYILYPHTKMYLYGNNIIFRRIAV